MRGNRVWKHHVGVVIDSVGGFDVIKCETCEFIHVVPVPSFDQLEPVYRQEYYTTEKPLYLERYREDLDWWNLVYRERYDLFEGYLPPDRRRVLDVGSGPGYFLLHGQQRGWQGLGIEPSRQAADHGRQLGVHVIQEFLTTDLAGRLGKYDIVHMSEVLEHVPHPAEMLHLTWELLTPGGLLCAVVPNDYSMFQQALRMVDGYAPWWVSPPHHINYFGFETLARLLESCGFDVIKRQATFPIDLFLLMGDNYIGNDALGRQCHAKRKRFEQALESAGMSDLRQQLYQAFAALGIGREILMIGRKKP
jgi:2-polyprenyl-3-methyl-5-hydroxy-6-metoxy-1,4-benzoquinol methylase